MNNGQRDMLLRRWASGLSEAASKGALTGDPTRPIHIRRIETIAGPRAGALEVDAGFDAERMLKISAVLAAQLVPWDFIGKPAIYQSGRYVRVEAGWPDSLAEKNIKLADLGANPRRSGCCILGKNEMGYTVTFTLSDNAPHVLVSGTTGSGKTVCVRLMVAQWSVNGDQLILIDGKFGEGLRQMFHLPGVIGPLARDVESARRALAWAYAEMVRRYESGEPEKSHCLIVVIDEIQELIGDPAIAEMVRRLVAQGRAARIHVVLTTQKPVRAALGDATIKTNLMGRIALRVDNAKSSEVAIGQSAPRADWLLGAGDAYAIVPGAVQRLQVAYIPRTDMDRLLTSTPDMREWPEFKSELLGQNISDGLRFSGEEMAVSLINAAQGRLGRTSLENALRDDGLIQNHASADRLRLLLSAGRDTIDALRDREWDVCLSGNGIHTKSAKKPANRKKRVYAPNRQTAIEEPARGEEVEEEEDSSDETEA